MKKKKWSLSDVEATIAIVVITVTASVNFVMLRNKVNNLNCQLIQFQILQKKLDQQDHKSSIKANTVTKILNKDVLDYWRDSQGQVLKLGVEIQTLEERRAKEC